MTTAPDEHESNERPTGVRREKIWSIVAAVEHDPTLTKSWVADRLAEIPASLDEFDLVREERLKAALDGDPMRHADVESMVLRTLRRERDAAADTDHWLAQAREREDFDWSGVARLVGVDEGVLRRRAGAPIDGKVPRVDVRGGLPMSAAAKALGVSRATLYTWISQGKVDQVVIDGRKVIATDASGRPIVR